MDARERLDQIRDRLPDFVVGGRLCLDFANTVEPRGGPITSPTDRERANQRDYLRDYADVILWALSVDALLAYTATDLLRRLDRSPHDAVALFRRAIALREAIYASFWRLAHGEPAMIGDLVIIEAEFRAALASATLAPDAAGRYDWRWPERAELDRPIALVAVSAVDLLQHGDPRRIKACPGGPGAAIPCAWLFYDGSRNRSRHWCTMEDCGTATKIRRLTERRRAQRHSDDSAG